MENQRIAIIGAGAAGLTAAETLREQGYTHITLFEQSDHAGGKCASIRLADHVYELGAGILSQNNRTALRLIEKYHIPLAPAEFGRSITVDSFTGKRHPEPSIRTKLMALWILYTRYRRLFRKFPSLLTPGHAKAHVDLSLPFVEFAEKYRIEVLIPYLNMFFTGFGYAYLSDVPAAYVLKYNNWETIKAFMRKQVYIIPPGIQHLWTRIAEEHDVRYTARISAIERNDDSVHITTQRGTEQFNKLIVAAPLDEFTAYSDASAQETALFSAIHYVDYRTIACTVKQFPKASGYAPGNFVQHRSGYPVFWYHRHKDTTVYTFYTLADFNISDDTIIQNTTEFVEMMGGAVDTVHHVQRWKYFPHVDSATYRSGYYDQLEALQGMQSTYYIGELLNFSCVGFTTEYAEYVIKRYFA